MKIVLQRILVMKSLCSINHASLINSGESFGFKDDNYMLNKTGFANNNESSQVITKLTKNKQTNTLNFKSVKYNHYRLMFTLRI